MSSINRILRNRAAERAAAEFARAAGVGLYAAGPHPYFNSAHYHPGSSHHLSAGWPTPGAPGHPWMMPPLASGLTGAASALLLPPSLSPGTAAATATVAGSPEHALHADSIARSYLQGIFFAKFYPQKRNFLIFYVRDSWFKISAVFFFKHKDFSQSLILRFRPCKHSEIF